MPYVQIFFQLRDRKELWLKYGIVVCPKSEPTRQRVLGPDNQDINESKIYLEVISKFSSRMDQDIAK